MLFLARVVLKNNDFQSATGVSLSFRKQQSESPSVLIEVASYIVDGKKFQIFISHASFQLTRLLWVRGIEEIGRLGYWIFKITFRILFSKNSISGEAPNIRKWKCELCGKAPRIVTIIPRLTSHKLQTCSKLLPSLLSLCRTWIRYRANKQLDVTVSSYNRNVFKRVFQTN